MAGHPFSVAVDESKVEVLAVLIEAGADVNQSDHEGRTPLHRVASNDYGYGLADRLLAAGCDGNAQDKEGETPLHRATRFGVQWAVELLVHHGANLAIKNKAGETACDILMARAHSHWHNDRILKRHVCVAP